MYTWPTARSRRTRRMAGRATEDGTVGIGILTLIGAIVVIVVLLRLLGLW